MGFLVAAELATNEREKQHNPEFLNIFRFFSYEVIVFMTGRLLYEVHVGFKFL